MKGYIGYIRVSTPKQGQGVSLPEQRDAILRYAERNRLNVTIWLEEMETAAKKGRPIFNQALKLLRTGKAQGIILHKLDRGARNLRDWTDIGELSDQGVEIHFVTEGIDLQSRSGRLSADIQAVVAADYIRNLRDETRKGFYGRLKQGLYPLQAPLGYLDQGGGKAKIIDPIRGPLIRRAFELYGTGQYNLHTLNEELYRLGLRKRNGGRMSISTLGETLNNPFHFGLIHIKTTGETFAGIHQPIINKALFDRVHAVLTGKTNTRSQKHDFLYRRTISCADCHFTLIAERQKGNVYYRCHTKNCPQPCVREDIIKMDVLLFMQHIRFDEKEEAYFKARLLKQRDNWVNWQEQQAKALNLQLNHIKDRLNRLTDVYLDQAIDRTTFEERKQSLLVEQKTIEENLANSLRNKSSSIDELENFLELAGNAWLSHQLLNPQDARQILRKFTSNRLATGKKLDLTPSLAFEEIVNRSKNETCCLERDIPRTWDRILDVLTKLNTQGLLPDLSALAARPTNDCDSEMIKPE